MAGWRGSYTRSLSREHSRPAIMGGYQGHALQEQHTKRGHCMRRTRGPRSTTTRHQTKTQSRSSPWPGAASSPCALTAHLPDVDPVSPVSGWWHLRSPQQEAGHALRESPLVSTPTFLRKASPPFKESMPTRGLTQAARLTPACAPPVAHPARGPLDTTSRPCPVEQETASTEACRKSSQRRTTSFVGGPPSSPCGTHPDSLLLLRSPAQDPPQPGALACSARLGRWTVMLSGQVSGAHSLP